VQQIVISPLGFVGAVGRVLQAEISFNSIENV
jgi:hypothetical protein